MNIIVLILFVILQSAFFASAAPHPATATSMGVSPQAGLFFARKGFTFPAPSHWTLESDATENEDEFSVEYKSKVSSTAKLSLKTDTLKAYTNLETYAKKWMKDYSSYGFDLLGAKSFTNESKAKGLVIDLKHKKKNQQLRQVVFLNQKTSVTLTCVDEIKVFQQTLSDCNLFFKNFSWLKPEVPTTSK